MIAGFEVDIGLTPDFFGDADVIGSNNLITIMGNLVIDPSLGRVRPYGLVGAGVLRTQVDGVGNQLDVSRNDVAVSAGGGIIALFSDSIGIRGDARIFRNTGDDEQGLLDVFDLELGSFSFWRLSAGLAVRF